ncbi:MAG: SPFH domain-containing protein [Nannocystaceae bacterium]
MEIIDGSGNRVRARINGLLKRLGGGRGSSILWFVLAFIMSLVLLFTSFSTIEPGQVAVRVNNITGEQEDRTQPGLVFRAPFGIHSVYIIDASPQTFVMKGNKALDALHVQELTVRASDGSNFLFKDTTIIFQVLGASAREVIRDAGPKDEFRRWMRPYARAILRDEFGRESTISVSNPAKFGEATERARARLNELLEPHGVTVTKIVTPRPRFNEQYENLIEARNEAENQLTVIESELQRAATDRERVLAEVDRDQNKIIQERRAALEAALATAIAKQADTIREVDTYRIETVAKGQAAKSAAERQAEELEGQLLADYEANKAAIDAFKTQPVERVMERLGEKLQGVTIDIQPWADDSTPSRLRVEQVGGVQ